MTMAKKKSTRKSAADTKPRGAPFIVEGNAALSRASFQPLLLRLQRTRSAICCAQLAVVNSEAHDTSDDIGEANIVLMEAIESLQSVFDDLERFDAKHISKIREVRS
jgi:hypothetical protein